jgi:hypothetical protein
LKQVRVRFNEQHNNKSTMANIFIFIGIVELGLLGLPILAFTIAKSQILSRRKIFWFYSFFGVLGLGRIFNLSFRGDVFDMILPVGLYLGYCILVFYLLKIDNKILRLTTFIIGFIPIAHGYIMATVGVLGIMMISVELFATKSTDLQESFYYREYDYGNATSSDGGTIIEFYKSPIWFPLIEKRLLTKKVSYLQYNTERLNVTLELNKDSYNLKIFSKDSLQFDTLISR